MFRRPILIALAVLGLAALACSAGSQGASEPVVARPSGEELFRNLGCAECHNGTVAVAAPELQGLYGQEVQLESGETVVADEVYLRESILSPKAKIVRGYQPIMPDFKGRLSDQELDTLVEYIQSLAR